MADNNLRGVLTALVTPMNKDGSIDFGALDALVDQQLEAGIDGLVPCGTTGESVTLNSEERAKVITAVVKKAANKATVVAGAGANSTAVAIEHQKRAKDTGAHYALVVTPYYNRPTPEGLFRHYSALLEAVDLPIILYNVPNRTGCDMLPETVARLAKLRGIVAVKEASNDLDRVAALRDTTDPSFTILSGEDGTCCPFALLGGDGVISVASNVAPREMVMMIHAALAGQAVDARVRHHGLRTLFKALSIESNPIPVKAALTMMGIVQENYRLPLCELRPENREALALALKGGGWIA